MIEKNELVLPDTPSKALRASDAPLANYKDNNNFDVDINELDLEFEEQAFDHIEIQTNSEATINKVQMGKPIKVSKMSEAPKI